MKKTKKYRIIEDTRYRCRWSYGTQALEQPLKKRVVWSSGRGALLLLVALMVSSCDRFEPLEQRLERPVNRMQIGNCRYIYYRANSAFLLFGHDGECPNPIHRCNCATPDQK